MANKEQRKGEGISAGSCAPEKGGGQVSEIRRYLLRFAIQKKFLVKEHESDFPCPAWFARIESGDNVATAISYESADSALFMAFISFENSEYNFCD